MENKPLEKTYSSPRWTMEIPDCSMPMTMDTYSKCAYNCLYCFSFFQKSHCLSGYLGGQPRSVNPEKVVTLFDKAMRNDREGMNRTSLQFYPYIQNRRIMQWGGLADEFDEWERRYGLTLELLRYFDRIDYPLSFSTKAAWWTEDSRYMELFARHKHNWHVKISIITADREKARRMERGVPSPEERLAAMKRLTDIGIHVTLRLRPFIIGVSGDYRKLIGLAHDAGADSVTTEFFCMESRANADLKKRYAEMSKICGFDIHKYYMENSHQQGYKRLNRSIKAPIIHDMRDCAHGLGMRFHVSDAFCRECNDACNCCGVPPEWGVSQTGNIGQAIIAARENGEVHWSDIRDGIDRYFSFPWNDAAGYNTGSSRARALQYDTTMAQFLRDNWNNPGKGTSPARGYGGILKPVGRDGNGDIVYKYAMKAEGEKQA
ncbi:MAG: radical SAM protein [Bacteroidales bacterium]|nr:radical SAM protein [Bacteroidales bacterium]